MKKSKPLTDAEKLDTEIKTVDTILQRGVEITLPAPWLFRLFGKKTIRLVVRRPTMRAMLKVTREYLEMKKKMDSLSAETIDEAHVLLLECAVPASRIIAHAIIRSTSESIFLTRLLSWYVLEKMDARMMAEATTLIVCLAGVHDFCNSIKSISALRITIPPKEN